MVADVSNSLLTNIRYPIASQCRFCRMRDYRAPTFSSSLRFDERVTRDQGVPQLFLVSVNRENERSPVPDGSVGPEGLVDDPRAGRL